MKYPITVNKIVFSDGGVIAQPSPSTVGKFVRVVPCSPAYEGKTFLGLYIGDIALGIGCSHKEENVLEVYLGTYNPAIFVFDLNKLIFGAESWWGEIETEDDLKQITNQDIENVWYVKALKQIQAKKDEGKGESSVS